jgi:hypothetical protein
MTTKEREKLRRNTEVILCEDFYVEDNIDSVVSKLQRIKNKNSNYSSIKIEKVEYGYPYDDHTYTRFDVVGSRPETDEEMDARLLIEKERQDKYAKERRTIYEQLKSEFGNE